MSIDLDQFHDAFFEESFEALESMEAVLLKLNVGARNIEFVRKWLKVEGLRITVQDVGDVYPRRVVYFPATGKVLVKRLRSLDGKSIDEREQQYLVNLRQQPEGNDVELFD